MNPKINTIINKYKTDKQFQSKVLKSSGLAIGAIIFIIIMTKKDENNMDSSKVLTPKVIPMDNYIMVDTTNIINDKNQAYQYSEIEKKDGSELVLGEINSNKKNENADIDAYLKNRQIQVNRMNQYSSNSPSQSKGYNAHITNTKYSRRNLNLEIAADIAPTNTVTPPINLQELPKEKTLEDIIREKNKKKNTISNEIRVAIHNDQTISSSNNIVRLRLIEPINFNGFKINTDQFIYAKASLGNNSINLFVENITYENQIIPINMWAFDYRTGNKGISVSSDNILGSSQKTIENKANQTIATYGGQIGGLIRDIFSGRNKQQRINLVNETYLFLKKD